MTHPARHFGLTLDHRALFNIPDAAGLQIDCEEGTVWVTVDGDLRDYVLEPGDHFHNAEHRRAVIYAMRPSSLSITSTRATASVAAPRKSAPANRGFVLEQVFA